LKSWYHCFKNKCFIQFREVQEAICVSNLPWKVPELRENIKRYIKENTEIYQREYRDISKRIQRNIKENTEIY